MKTADIIRRIAKTDMYPSTRLAGDTHADTIIRLKSELGRRDIPWRLKPASSLSPYSATVTPTELLLPVDWRGLSSESQAGILWHELTHYLDGDYMTRNFSRPKWWKARRNLVWWARYVSPAWRVIGECRAYGAGIQYSLHMDDITKRGARDRVQALPEHLMRKYMVPWTMRAENLHDVVTTGLYSALKLH